MNSSKRFVSRAGEKLAHALKVFNINVSGFSCADLGCNIGGFTDVLLQNHASSVIAVDTGYGMFDWSLRNDPRVEIRERENALHSKPPQDGVDLVVIDLGWTPQRKALPAAISWLKPNGCIITLVKPHYELNHIQQKTMLKNGRISDVDAENVLNSIIETLPTLRLELKNKTWSPIRGLKSSKKGQIGNREALLYLSLY